MIGRVEISGINLKTGKIDWVERTSNLIVNGMYNKLTLLLGGTANSYVNRMQFGTGTLAPVVTQEFLQTPITPVKAVTSAMSTTDDYIVEFEAILQSHEANGFPISEAALLTAGTAVMVARATFLARTKTSDYAFGFKWLVRVRTT